LSLPPSPFEGRRPTAQPYSNRVWNPGGKKILPNQHVSVLVATALVVVTNDDDDSMSIDDENSRTELDLHVNIVVVGHWTACLDHKQHRENGRSQSIYTGL
jgi:hypothetical protein